MTRGLAAVLGGGEGGGGVGFAAPYASGRWYNLDGCAGSTNSSFGHTELWYKPFVVYDEVELSQLKISVATLATLGVARLGIAEDGTDGNPGDTLADLGTVSTASTGVKTLDFTNVILVPGVRYWEILNCQVASPNIVGPAATVSTSAQALSSMSDSDSDFGFSNNYSCIKDTATCTGVLPAAWTGPVAAVKSQTWKTLWKIA